MTNAERTMSTRVARGRGRPALAGAVAALAAAALAAGLTVVPSDASVPGPVNRATPGLADALTARSPDVLRGRVMVAGEPVRRAYVELYRAGRHPGKARLLEVVRSDRDGRFVIDVPRRVTGSLYLTSLLGKIGDERLPRAVGLATALGDKRSGRVVLNERTTVASGFALAQFAERGSIGGADPGLANAMWMTRNLVRIGSGKTAGFLRKSPNGTATQTLPTFNALASIIAGCATGANDCDAFLRAATDAWGHRPRDTWQAMTLLPQNPSGDADGVYAEVPARPQYRPVVQEAPAAWLLALKFVGNGRQFNGPGNVAFDEDGKVWSNNNAEWAVKLENVCAGLEIFKVDPYSPRRPVTSYYGGGLNGAGFGIAFDPDHHLWVANFGFSGTKCPTPPTSNSMSEFLPDGTPVSPDEGYTEGPLSWPQGAKSDRDGNIWIANCGNSTVVRYPDGDPTQAQLLEGFVGRAFDVAFNTEGNAFVTANEGNQVFGYTPDGDPLPGSPYGDESVFAKPMGIASDRLGNTWVSNSGVIPSPCTSGQTFPDLEDVDESTLEGSVVRVGPEGELTLYEGAGLTIPWGIAVDGDDNIWVANFTGQRVSHLCGSRPATCPTGQSGDSISPPETGYPFDGLQRNTAVQVDPSGNLWITNNWKKIPLQVNPFGNGLVVYLGVAPPVRAPLIGPPQLP